MERRMMTIMEPLYIVCPKCKEAVCAGKRWAFAYLVMPGLAPIGGAADAEGILKSKDYWRVPDGEEWNSQRELLPKVRTFFDEHAGHPLRSGFVAQISIPLFQGERFRTKQPLKAGCITHWNAPFSGTGNNVPLPANEIIVLDDLIPGARGVGCNPERYEELHDHFVPAELRIDPLYEGYHLVIEVITILTCCKRAGN